MEENEIDWRDIFIRYVESIEQSESVAMLDARDWQPEEWVAILNVLDREPNQVRL